MFSKKVDLDRPFKTGETVQTTTDLHGMPEGTTGKVRLSNGLGVYRRYWVKFGSEMVGQVDHHNLVRPNDIDAWHQREEDRKAEAENAAVEVVEDAGASAEGGNSLGIPEALLERSRAAKKRLLG